MAPARTSSCVPSALAGGMIGALREWGDFDTGRPATWLYPGGLLAGDLALALLYRSMSRQREEVCSGGV